MAQVKCEVSDGLRNSEATVKLWTYEGRYEYLPVDRGLLSKVEGQDYLAVGLIHVAHEKNAALISLPIEADSGAHRVWVPCDSLRDMDDDTTGEGGMRNDSHCVWCGRQLDGEDLDHCSRCAADAGPVMPPIDPEKVAAGLLKQCEAVQAELRRLEEAKMVSPETMQMVIGPRKPQL